MHQELRHQVKIHRISEKLNKGIKICIFPPPLLLVENKSRKTTKTCYTGKEKKSSPSMQGKGKLDPRERGLMIPR
jgi:hypothetical protein